jgi:hypothetical protein
MVFQLSPYKLCGLMQQHFLSKTCDYRLAIQIAEHFFLRQHRGQALRQNMHPPRHIPTIKIRIVYNFAQPTLHKNHIRNRHAVTFSHGTAYAQVQPHADERRKHFGGAP